MALRVYTAFLFLVLALSLKLASATTVTVTDGPSFYSALLGSGPGTIVIQAGSFALTRGLTTTGKWRIVCAAGYACDIDISTVTNTEAFIIHGGASVTIVGITFDGKNVDRYAPGIYLTGQNSKLALDSTAIINCNYIVPGALGGAIETDRNTVLTIYGASSFSNDFALDGGAIGITYQPGKEVATVVSCFADFTGDNAGIVFQQNNKKLKKAPIYICASAHSAAPTVIANNLTATYSAQFTAPGTCSFSACSHHGL